MKYKKYFSIIILSFLIAMFTLFISINSSLKTIEKINNWENEINKNDTYFKIQHEDNPLHINISSFNKLYNELKNTKLYSFYEIYNQPLDITHGTKKFFDTQTNQLSNRYNRVHCIQISENVQKEFNLFIEKGRLLNQKDYMLNEKNIPVLMGYDYINLFHIGDNFIGNYLFDDYNFYIVGFLKEKSQIKTSLKEFQLDKMIIIPSFNITNKIKETKGLKIHYANKTSGLIKPFPNMIYKTKQYIDKLIKNTTAGNYSLEVSPISTNFKLKTGIELNILKNIVITLTIILFSLTILIIYHLNKKINIITIKNNIIITICTIVLYAILSILMNLLLNITINIFYGIQLIICFNLTIYLFCFLINKFKKLTS